MLCYPALYAIRIYGALDEDLCSDLYCNLVEDLYEQAAFDEIIARMAAVTRVR